MEFVKYARCIKCGHTVPTTPELTLCPQCHGLLDMVYDYDRLRAHLDRDELDARAERTLWRFRELLPVEDGTAAHMAAHGLRVGGSPLYDAAALAQQLGLRQLWIKDDGQNPTSSLKDRASAIAVAKALEAGKRAIACSSTGNAASSLAGSAARAGLESYIFVPQRAPQGKVAQLLIFGAHVYSVQGDYGDTFRLSAAAIERYGWYNRNAAINPYLLEGKKTVSLELAQQLGWRLPDYVAVSVGDGCTVAGVWKGLCDLRAVGFIDRLPQLIAVQAAGCCPINTAYLSGQPLQAQAENTLADSIAVGVPRNPDKALSALRESGAVAVNVSDEEILSAMRCLGQSTGVFAEPAAAAALAGVIQAQQDGRISAGSSVACLITGNGLKDVAHGVQAAGQPQSVQPDIDSFCV